MNKRTGRRLKKAFWIFSVVLIFSATIISAGNTVSIPDAQPVQEPSLTSEPFKLNLQYVDLQTSLVFLPTDEEVGVLREMLSLKKTALQDSENNIWTDGYIELTIHIAPGEEELAYLPLRFGIASDDGTMEDLYVWESETHSFSKTLVVRDVRTDVEKSVSLTLLLSPDLIEGLRGNLDVDESPQIFKVFSWIQDEPENKVEITDLKIVEIPERFEKRALYKGTPLNWSKNYSKGFSNNYFGADFGGGAYAKFNNSGASAWAGAAANLTILSNKFEFIGADASAAAVPHNIASSFIDMDIRFLSFSIWSYHKDASFTYYDKKSFLKEKGYSQIFMIAIIPCSLEAGGSGELGIQWEFGVNENLYAKMGPFVDIGAYAKASVTLVIAWAGVKGTLSLLKDEFWGQATASMQLQNNASDLFVNLNFKVWNDLSGPSGKFGPYVGWYEPKVCYKQVCVWPFPCANVPYPCISEGEKWWVMVDWSSWKRTDTLLDLNQSTTINLL